MSRRQENHVEVIAFVAQKGGAGKTSLCCHWAHQVELGGGRALIIDLDSAQFASHAWWFDRAAHGRRATPECVRLENPKRLGAEIARARDAGFDVVCIDTTPTYDHVIVAAVEHADWVVVPVRPSGLDVRLVGETAGLCARVGTDWTVVFTQCPPGSRLLLQAREALEDFVLCPGTIRARNAWINAMIDGGVVHEERSPRLAQMEFEDAFAWHQSYWANLPRGRDAD